MKLRNVVLRIALLFVLLPGISFLTGCTTITPGNVGIEISKTGASRGAQDVAVKSGLVLYNPFLTNVIEYPVFVQTVKWTAAVNEGNPADESLTFSTKDSMTINADVSLSYQLNQDKAPEFYVKYRADEIEKFTDGPMRNVVRNAFNTIAGEYTVEDIMGNNGPILKRVEAQIQSELGKDGIVVTNLGFIGVPRPPAAVIASINSKVQAEQLALQKQNEVAQAEAEAKKNIAYADGDAKANVIRAQADAEANRLRSQSLTPALVQWTAIQKWDGKRPEVEGAGSGLIIQVK